MTINIVNGDCLDQLFNLPTNHFQTCVTSPPYFGLRDYGVAGQIGLEASLDEYIDKMVDVFRAVRRVLRDDGTLWLNLGDSYANDAKWGGSSCGKHVKALHGNTGVGRQKKSTGMKPKDLMMVPSRVALALQADGWWLRSDIIWHKPNPMPESCQDRPTSAHEHVFLLTKSARYFYDADAIREPMAASSVSRLAQDLEHQEGSSRANGSAKTNGPMKAVAKGNSKTFRGGGSYTGGNSYENSATCERDSHGNAPNPTGDRNSRNVWTIATHPFKEAHFATFPPALAERCILAGSRRGDTVLDPFGGAGTTGLVADRLQRSAVLIELNPEYADIARRRIRDDRGVLLNYIEGSAA